MAQVIWNKKASLQLEAHLDYALEVFGCQTVNNWYTDIRRIESRLTIFTKSFTTEPLLKNRDKEYRGAILMKNFKLIHYYDETKDVVYIESFRTRRHQRKSLRIAWRFGDFCLSFPQTFR